MYITPETYIRDARNFQRFGEYDLAIDSLEKAQGVDLQRKHEIEIQKLLSFNFRKLGHYDIALLKINNAINALQSTSQHLDIEHMQNEYAICLMNKGVIYEEMGAADKAIGCYLPALERFVNLFNNDVNNYGIIINALLTIGMFYFNQKQYSKAKEYLEKALSYFERDNKKEADRRYIAIVNTLREIDKA